MTRKRRKKEDVLNEFRRSELVAAARHVFGTHGFENATMDAIARQADVAKGTVYLYYRSKRDIYEATLRACMEDLEAIVRDRVEAAAPLQAAIAAFVAARVTYFQEHQDFFRMYVDEIGSQVRRATTASDPVRRDDRSADAPPRAPHLGRGRTP